jgi:hypothetical protein
MSTKEKEKAMALAIGGIVIVAILLLWSHNNAPLPGLPGGPSIIPPGPLPQPATNMQPYNIYPITPYGSQTGGCGCGA